MSTIVDRCYLEIDGEVVICASITEDIDPTVNPVEGMTRDNRILGHAQGNPKLKLSAEVPQDAESEVDFERLALNKTEFSAFIEFEGGAMRTYTGCVVAKVSNRAQTGREVVSTVEISATDVVLG
jgi:hypothetical protein